MITKLAQDIARIATIKLAMTPAAKDFWTAARTALKDIRTNGIKLERVRPNGPPWLSATGGKGKPVLNTKLPVGQSEFNRGAGTIRVGKGVPRDFTKEEAYSLFGSPPKSVTPDEARQWIQGRGVNRSPMSSFLHEYGHYKSPPIDRRNRLVARSERDLGRHLDKNLGEVLANTHAIDMLKTPEGREFFAKARLPSYYDHLKFNGGPLTIRKEVAPNMQRDLGFLHGMPGYAKTPEQRAQLELMKNTEY